MTRQEHIRNNIVATIAYYDVFEYPLSAFEVWKYLLDAEYFEDKCDVSVTLEEIVAELERLTRKSIGRKGAEEYRGFYYLPGRKKLVTERIRRNKLAVFKMKHLRSVVKLLRFIPYVRMVGVTGRLAMKNVWLGSDWDVLIVFKKGKIWTGRTLVTLVTQLLGKRRHRTKIRDRVCLNYFLASDALEIKTKDLFSANEYFFIFPLLDVGNTFHRFQLKNGWIRKFKPQYYVSDVANLKLLNDTLVSRLARSFWEVIFRPSKIEELLARWERRKIRHNPKTHQMGSMIEASDEALVFLPDPKGPKVFDKFKENMGKLRY